MEKIVQFNKPELERKLAAAKVKTEFEKIEPRLKKLPQYRGRIPSKTFLNKNDSDRIEKGQCYWIDSENGLYVIVAKTKKGIQLRPLDLNATVSTGYTIYEMNQAMTAKEPLLDLGNWRQGDLSETFQRIEKKLVDFYDQTNNEMYLLYGRDLHYFTVFQKTADSHNCPLELLLDCLEYNWDIVSIDVDMSEDDGMPKVEVWVRDVMKPGAKENALANHMLYLMPFDEQVVQL